VESVGVVGTSSILVVEDDATLVRSIVRNLSVRGHRTRSVESVATAKQALVEECPALMVLDIELPDGSGWEVLRSLRAGTCADTAVIVMSALRPNARLAGEFQCMAVLEKPFPMDSLVRLITESLEHDAGQTSHRPLVDRRKTHD
jgi:DNA-binding response OmpR family regulator